MTIEEELLAISLYESWARTVTAKNAGRIPDPYHDLPKGERHGWRKEARRIYLEARDVNVVL